MLGSVLALMSLVGCVKDRGAFGVVSPDDVGPYERVSSEVVIGSACFDATADGPVFRRALDDALRQAPGADALVGVKISDEGKCVYVAGFPARAVSRRK